MENRRRPLSKEEKKNLDKQRKSAAKKAQKYHKEQEKKAKKSSEKQKMKKPSSKIQQKIDLQAQQKRENISREEKFRRQGEQKIRNIEPRDFKDGYYVDEYGEKVRQERRAKEIHQQETEVIRRRKKPLTPKQIKRRRIILYSSIFLIVLIIGTILSLTVLFKTENIVVEGDDYYYDDQVIAFSGVELQQNIFIAAMGSTPESISENLPYVESAVVNFTIPDTITIKIVDAVPSYVIKNGDSYLLISSKGRILDNIDKNTDKLPELKCDELKSTKIGDYVSFSDENVPDILEDISNSLNTNKVEGILGIDVTNTANIKLDFDGRITINIGLPEDIDYKIRTAMAIINEKLDPNNTGTVAGTLDVSSCSTTKMSHYKPAETSPIVATQPSTAAADSSGDGTGTYNDGTGTYGDGTGTYNDGTGTYGDGTGTYDDGTGTYGDGTGTYGDGTITYDDGTGIYGDGAGAYPAD